MLSLGNAFDEEDLLLFRKDSVSIFLIPSSSGNLHELNFGLSSTAMHGCKCRLYLRFLSNTYNGTATFLPLGKVILSTDDVPDSIDEDPDLLDCF